jgi:hypothetical protein
MVEISIIKDWFWCGEMLQLQDARRIPGKSPAPLRMLFWRLIIFLAGIRMSKIPFIFQFQGVTMKHGKSRKFRFLSAGAFFFLMSLASFYGAGSATQSAVAQSAQSAPTQKISPVNPAARILGAPVNDGQIANVASPTGQGMYLGTTVKIQWQWPGYETAAANVLIMDEGTTKGSIKQVGSIITDRTGLWTSWAIPYTFAPGYYTIRVSSSKNPNNYSDYRIMVMNTTITITSPNSNFDMAMGSMYTIWWNYKGNPGPVKLELTNTSGSTPLAIVGSAPGGELGVGKFNWTVPTTLAKASGYLVQVTSLASPSITAVSQPFSIAPPSITITSPQTSSEHLPAVYVPILWKSLGSSFGSTVHITAWPTNGAGTSLDVLCPLSQGIYDRWMPMPLDMKQNFFIRVESTQNRSIGAQIGPITILPRQKEPGGAGIGIGAAPGSLTGK